MDTNTKRKKSPPPAIDIGRETRLELYRLQLELRYCEKRAYDLFLQNLIKGTSHLSLGQEAIAAAFGVAMRPDDWTFCTYRGHAHTLARGASMEGVLGELMGRQCGLLGGKGGSMHLTDVKKGAMGSYAIIGAHLPVAAGAAWSAQYPRHRAGRGVLLRRRHHQHRRVPRGAQFFRGMEAAGDLRVREQSLHGIHADQRGDRGRASGRRPRSRLRIAVHRRRRQRCRRGLQGGQRGVDQGARRRRAVADRSHDLSPQRAFARRSGEIPARRRAREMAAARSDRDVPRAPAQARFQRTDAEGHGSRSDGQGGRGDRDAKASPLPSIDDIEKNVWADGGSAWRN